MIVIFSKKFAYHNDSSHIENNRRIKTIYRAIKESDVKIEKPYKFNKKIYKIINLAHSWKYIKNIKKKMLYSFKNRKILYIDSDTYISPLSYYSVFSSVLSVIKAINIIKEHEKIFIPTRPPGHHAGKNGLANITQGFCIFNNVAIGAMYARKKYRVLILDIDIHHGNGTEEIVRDKKNIFFISTHAKGIYPFTGLSSYKNIINYPLEYGTNDKKYIEIFQEILNKIKEIDPDIIFVSLGFDMHHKDPLSVFNVTLDSYKFVFEKLKDFRVIYVLEGGYNLNVLYEGTRILLNIYK